MAWSGFLPKNIDSSVKVFNVIIYGMDMSAIKHFKSLQLQKFELEKVENKNLHIIINHSSVFRVQNKRFFLYERFSALEQNIDVIPSLVMSE